MSINGCITLLFIITQPLAHYKRSEKVYKFQFIAQSAKPTMQNVECKMQNEGVALGDLFQLFPKEIPQFCILHFEFCISCVSTINCNLQLRQGGEFGILSEKRGDTHEM